MDTDKHNAYLDFCHDGRPTHPIKPVQPTWGDADPAVYREYADKLEVYHKLVGEHTEKLAAWVTKRDELYDAVLDSIIAEYSRSEFNAPSLRHMLARALRTTSTMDEAEEQLDEYVQLFREVVELNGMKKVTETA